METIRVYLAESRQKLSELERLRGYEYLTVTRVSDPATLHKMLPLLGTDQELLQTGRAELEF